MSESILNFDYEYDHFWA